MSLSSVEPRALPSEVQEPEFAHPVSRWVDTRSFLAAPSHDDGIHVVGDGAGRQTEMLLGGTPFEVEESSVLVIFSGAVTNRGEKVPPFFSGSGLAASTGLPFIAFSDPSLELSEDLAIGWYAGSDFHDTQREILDLLSPLSLRLQEKLWTVGGSAGGFAALWFGHALPGAPSVFVWNPQTDLLEYSASFVRQYLAAARPTAAPNLDTQTLRRVGVAAFRDAGHSSSVLEFLPTQSPSRLLYLQNATDSHLPEHCVPYLRAHGYARYAQGLWRRDRESVVWISDVAKGHMPPTREQLIDLLTRVTHSEGDMLGLVRDLDLTGWFGDALHARPEPLAHVSDLLAPVIEVASENGGVVVRSDLPDGLAGLHWEARLVKDGEVLEESVLMREWGTWTPEVASAGATIEVTVKDGFAQQVLRRVVDAEAPAV